MVLLYLKNTKGEDETMNHWRVVLFACAFALLGVVAATNMRDPFVGVHWDSPIWLHQAKGYAETSYLTAIRQCAQEFQSSRSSSADSPPYCFGYYSRLGHTILLGGLVQLFGPTEAVNAASRIFYLLLGLAVLFVGSITLNLHRALQGPLLPSNYVLSGIFISSFIYVSSELFSYIGNSLISDVPSLTLVSFAGLTLVRGLLLRSYWRLVLSGFCGFLAYVTRLESVWAYISLVLALASVFFLRRRHDTWWPGFLIAGLSSLLPFLAYWVTFYPLGSPFVYLAWAGRVSEIWSSESSHYGYIYLVRAGGLLWIGFLIYIAGRKLSIVGEMASIWLVLLIIPWVPWLFQQGPTQTRHYVLVMMPLMIFSSLGWANALKRAETRPAYRRRLWAGLPFVCVLGLISHTYNNQWIRQAPGLWRLDALWSDWMLGPSRSEQPKYSLDEAIQLSQNIYKVGSPTVVIRSKTIPVEDMLYLIRFFGPSYHNNPDFVKYATTYGPESLVQCSRLPPIPAGEASIYTTDLSERCRTALRFKGVRMLHLYWKEDLAEGVPRRDETVILTTKHYVLSKIN